MGSRKTPIRIAFYCDEYGQSWWHGWVQAFALTSNVVLMALHRWNRSHVDNGGLGGSEEAVVFLAEAIAAISDPLDRYMALFSILIALRILILSIGNMWWKFI